MMCNPKELGIYYLLKDKGFIKSINELASILNLDYKNAYRYVLKLEKKGIIQIEEVNTLGGGRLIKLKNKHG